jgi:DNA (cytosine-5)-methyltransferase 1
MAKIQCQLRTLEMLQREGFVRVKEAAELLGVCSNTVRAWGAEGRIPEYRHPANNYRLYKRRDLESLLRRLKQSVRKGG